MSITDTMRENFRKSKTVQGRFRNALYMMAGLVGFTVLNIALSFAGFERFGNALGGAEFGLFVLYWINVHKLRKHFENNHSDMVTAVADLRTANKALWVYLGLCALAIIILFIALVDIEAGYTGSISIIALIAEAVGLAVGALMILARTAYTLKDHYERVKSDQKLGEELVS